MYLELWLEDMVKWGSVYSLLKYIRYTRKGKARKAAVQVLIDPPPLSCPPNSFLPQRSTFALLLICLRTIDR